MLKRSLILLAVFSSLAGCFGAPGAGPHWKDGNYCVYSRPVSRDIIMGYYMGGGSILGLSEPTVTAAGADSRYVVFKREGGVTEYYYIEKKADGEGVTKGPFNENAFQEVSRAKSLPELIWNLNR